MYSQIFLMISVRASGLLPTTSARAGLGVSGALNPVFEPEAFLAVFLAAFFGATFFGAAAFLAAFLGAAFLTADFLVGLGAGLAAFFFVGIA